MKKVAQKLGLAIVGLTVSTLSMAQATPPDFATLTGSVDVATVITGIMAVAAVMVGVHLAWKGVQFIMRAVKGA